MATTTRRTDDLVSMTVLVDLRGMAEVRRLRRMALEVHPLDHLALQDMDGNLRDLPQHLEGMFEAHRQAQVQH